MKESTNIQPANFHEIAISVYDVTKKRPFIKSNFYVLSFYNIREVGGIYREE
jgi:hypothetical protein